LSVCISILLTFKMVRLLKINMLMELTGRIIQ
jgi:hypothetical protein